MFHLADGEAFALTRGTVILIVVSEAQEGQILNTVVVSIAVEMGNLALFDRSISVKSIADAAPSSRRGQNHVSDRLRQRISTRRQIRPPN